MLIKSIANVVFLNFLLIVYAPFSQAQNQQPDSYYSTGKLHHLLINYKADHGSLQRFYVIANSPERRERFQEFYSDYLRQLDRYNFQTLSVSDKVDYLLFERKLKNQLRLLEVEAQEYRQIQKYISFGEYIYHLEKLRRRGAKLEGKAVAQKLQELQQELARAYEALSASGGMSKKLAIRTSQTLEGLQMALQSVYQFYHGYDPQFSWWVKKPYEEFDERLTEFAQLAKQKIKQEAKDDGSGIIGNPIGRQELLAQLQLAMLSYTPEELVEIAHKEFAWCEKEMLKASQETGFGNDWKQALEKVKNTYVSEGQQPQMIMGLYNESVNFIKQHDLVTIPPLAEETWRMVMMSPEQQRISPFFLGGEVLMIAYPTDAMSHETKMMSFRGNNPHFSRAVVHHELIAGHHLQGYMNQRFKAYRNFRTPFWTEGWALYWEMILWDLDFPRSPEDRVGMLFWRMHRCARIIFSLNYHLKQWTPQQCIDFLVEKVGHERANAEGEVRRSFTGNYGPLYQLAYMTGALQFYALKKELVDSGKMSFKQFHDVILRENNIPVEMLRYLLIDQAPKRNFKSSWKFYQF
ncbi:DUF885 family protein [Rapidithrix thailandica]|uniref:DUF885 family protein n=1 Tax=Rapidithrix thailandica TaxID=413964 RepID=A0AAW9RXT1_9BACT